MTMLGDIRSEIKKIFSPGRGQQSQVAKNFFWLGFSELINRLLKLVLIIFVARMLGAVEYGKFTSAMAFASIFFIFTDPGLSQIMIREFSKETGKEKDISALLSLESILSLAALFFLWAGSFIITSDSQIRVLIWIMGMFVVSESFMSLAFSFFQARQKMHYLALAKISESLIVTAIGFYALFFQPSVFNLSLGYLAGAASVAFVLMIILNWKFLPLKADFNRSVWAEYLRYSWPLALSGIFVLLYTNIDSVMMMHMGKIAENGYYNAAQKIAAVSLIPAILAGVAFFPMLSRLFKGPEEKLRNIWSIYFNAAIFLAVPILFGGVALAPKIIDLVYSSEYLPSVQAFQILILMMAMNMVSFPFSHILLAFNQQKKIFWVTAFGAVLNIGFNIFLIPRYSLYGAAWASVIAFSAMLFSFVLLASKETPIKIFEKRTFLNFLVVLFSGTVMYLAVSQPLVSGLHPLLSVSIGVAIYSVCFFTGTILAGISGRKHLFLK
jgi:O-antigen/teichoic acid export membrane protein